jgi:DNA processing protein
LGHPLSNQNEHAPKSNNAVTTELSDTEKLARIQLYRSENVGPITFHQLLGRYKTAVEALNMLPELAQRGGRSSKLHIYPKEKVIKELESHEKHGAHLIVWGEALYPQKLCRIPDASPVLSYKGNPALFENQTIAIVGARNCSLVGKKLASTYAQELGEHGYTIASGLARGIDTAAHQGSLSTGTLAVIAGGIDQIYPPENNALYEQLFENGLVIAESPLGTEPQSNLFPRRNRLISGLSLGVIIIEAAFQSGSLITARYATEQGKEVFVVPGSPLDPRYKGSNHLLKQGANLITSSQDVIDVLEKPYMIPVNQDETDETLFHDETDEQTSVELSQEILSLLSTSAISLDELIRACRVSSMKIQGTILQLELAGKVIRHAGNSISRAP